MCDIPYTAVVVYGSPLQLSLISTKHVEGSLLAYIEGLILAATGSGSKLLIAAASPGAARQSL